MIEELERRTRSTFADEPHGEKSTHLDYVEHWIRGGNTLNELGKDMGFDPEFIGRYIRHTFSSDALDPRARLIAARKDGADRLAERVLEVGKAATPENANAARVHIDALKWTAEKFNPSDFGTKLQGIPQINIGQLHLEALRHRPVQTAPLLLLGGTASD